MSLAMAKVSLIEFSVEAVYVFAWPSTRESIPAKRPAT